MKRKLVKVPQNNPNKGFYYGFDITNEPSVIENLSGPAQGLSRVSLRTTHRESRDADNNLIYIVEADYSLASYVYILDPGGSLQYDDENGVATFSSKGIQYRIRAIQPEDTEYWGFLQEWKSREEEDDYSKTECPEATKNPKVNLSKTKKAIQIARYGPLLVDEDNESFWKSKAEFWNISVDEAKTRLCKDCSLFDSSDSIKKCIDDNSKDLQNALEDLDETKIGFCKNLGFICDSQRTCRAWKSK